jgi:5-methylthioadenosine/S-adenosylhomocysteine deaminase
MTNLVIAGTRVVPLDPSIGSVPDDDILIVDGRIAAVEAGLAAQSGLDAERIDGSGTIAVPGFVDTHRLCGRW